MKTLKSIGSLAFLLIVSATLHAQAIFDAVNTNDLSKVSALIEKDPTIISLKDNLGNTLCAFSPSAAGGLRQNLLMS